ncbi:hypothetical protein KJZ99_06375 [bacterium]|nr:hypothetical protein [bacterium]
MSNDSLPLELGGVKKQRERSRNHPGINLERALEFLAEFKVKVGSKATSRNSIAHVFGVSPSSGAFSTKIAACYQYNLLDGRGEGIAITALGKRMLHPLSPEDKQAAIMEAFRSPDLYSQLIADYAGDKLPTELANLLFHNYDISESAKENAARCFVESARFAGYLDANDRLIAQDTKAVSIVSKDSEQYQDAVIVDERNEPTESSRVSHSGQNITLAVTAGRKVTLLLPDELTEADIKILKAQLDVIGLQIQLNKDLSSLTE